MSKPSPWGAFSLDTMQKMQDLSGNFFTRHLQFSCLGEVDPSPGFLSAFSLTGERTFILSYKPALKSQSLHVGVCVCWRMLIDHAQLGSYVQRRTLYLSEHLVFNISFLCRHPSNPI